MIKRVLCFFICLLLFVNMIWAHAFLLSDKIPSLSRCLFLLASVR